MVADIYEVNGELEQSMKMLQLHTNVHPSERCSVPSGGLAFEEWG